MKYHNNDYLDYLFTFLKKERERKKEFNTLRFFNF